MILILTTSLSIHYWDTQSKESDIDEISGKTASIQSNCISFFCSNHIILSKCILLERSVVNGVSYMSTHVLLNLLNELRKRDKMRGLLGILSLFFAKSLINSIIQGHEC